MNELTKEEQERMNKRDDGYVKHQIADFLVKSFGYTTSYDGKINVDKLDDVLKDVEKVYSRWFE